MEAQPAIVVAEKQEVTASGPERASNVLEQAVFARAKWPIDVDPATASAYLMNGVLTLMVKRA